MAADNIPKSSKWFSNKSLNVSFQRFEPTPSARFSSSPPRSSPPRSPTSSTLAPKLANSEDELKDVFRCFDGNGDGKISALELRKYFASIGEFMSHEEAQGMIDDFDTDKDGLLDFTDFVRVMKRKDGDEDLRLAFEMFEVKKGSGCITPKGLQRMLKRLGDKRSYEDCVAMIQAFDIDGNGVLDFQEFRQMMS
ncbi:hypothetical protein L1049_025160 [Liquidambar formosana]|uniref:EF-hand domain-containing protein n=1 Tax=Liquidambar formosana TaxID=63359 RepID=A0AAP0RWW9_LIQFO